MAAETAAVAGTEAVEVAATSPRNGAVLIYRKSLSLEPF